MSYKCLTIWQPYASLILHGIKDVENRTRRTHYRGQLLIHAGKAWSEAGYNELVQYAERQENEQNWQLLYPFCCAMAYRGAILGTVDLVDCVQDSSSEWAEEGMYHWLLENPQPFDKPRPWCGRQGLWTIDAAKLEAARKKVAAR